MAIIIDGQSDKREVVKILLSDNKWYTLHEESYFTIDAFEIGFYDSERDKYYVQYDGGKGFEVYLEEGYYLKGKISEIKAYMTKKKQ